MEFCTSMFEFYFSLVFFFFFCCSISIVYFLLLFYYVDGCDDSISKQGPRDFSSDDIGLMCDLFVRSKGVECLVALLKNSLLCFSSYTLIVRFSETCSDLVKNWGRVDENSMVSNLSVLRSSFI